MTCRCLDALFLLLACTLLSACTNVGQEGGEGGEGGEANHEMHDPCCELGAVCHVIGEDVAAEVDECHEMGHRGVQAECEEHYESCMTACEGLNPEPVEHACE